MIYQKRGRKFKVAQVLELVFFAAIVGAFILLIPMKARAEEEQLKSRRGGNSLEFGLLESGEKSENHNEDTTDRLGSVFDWSDQLIVVVDRGIGGTE